VSNHLLNRSFAARLLTVVSVLVFPLSGIVLAEAPPAQTDTEVAPTQVAAAPTAAPPAVVKTDDKAASAAEKPKAWSLSLTGETSVGIGTFVSGDQNNSSVTTAFSFGAGYKLTDMIKLSAGVGLTWFNVLDFGTPLTENEVLLSDVSFTLSHASIYKHDDSGFNINGAFRVSLPTSKASQFQNRLFTVRPTLGASLPVGPVTFRYTIGLGKFFNSQAVPSIDCDDFDDEQACISGRDNNPEFGFESERRGAEVFLPGTGSNSFYLLNALSVNWTIVEGLDLTLGGTLYNTYGVRSLQVDEFSTEEATEGRSQTDRLITSLGLSYQIIKQVSVGASLVTDTVRPFGANGDDFVVFDFERAPDNITSLNFSVTGTL
jgi:hypothetical protein